jgi:hypothetical protein
LIVYAFDVDETLEISGGPVKLSDLQALRDQGHIVGICGNWAGFIHRVAGWQNLVSFVNAGTPNKETHLAELRKWIPADDFVFVGNVLGVTGASDDQGSAQRCTAAGFPWRFLSEQQFADGAR